MLNRNIEHDLIKEARNNLIKSMQTRAEKLLNPDNYHLSVAVKTRLRWFYLFYYEKQGNVTKAANKADISRQWLSKMKSTFEHNNRDPRSLEPQPKASHDTSKRKRISKRYRKQFKEIACMNTDNGSENEKEFSEKLQKKRKKEKEKERKRKRKHLPFLFQYRNAY